jgi:hypothetical protein
MDTLKIKGSFEVKLKRAGVVIEKREVENTITTVGLAEIANLAGNVATPTAFTYLALGIGTNASAISDTQLQSEITDTGLARHSATVSRVTTTGANDTLQLAYTWTATGSKAVTEVGTFNNSTGGTLLGRQVFSAVNTANGDTFSITYKFKFA